MGGGGGKTKFWRANGPCFFLPVPVLLLLFYERKSTMFWQKCGKLTWTMHGSAMPGLITIISILMVSARTEMPIPCPQEDVPRILPPDWIRRFHKTRNPFLYPHVRDQPVIYPVGLAGIHLNIDNDPVRLL